MRLLKSHPILGLANSYLVDSPQPSNLSYMWNFGSLLGVCLIIQILTGVFLAMHYTPSVDLAFISVEHIMRDVNYGWLIRYLHANTASFFFIFVYLHIGRGLYYGSYKSPRTLLWSIGVIILVLMMAIAFLGFIGQKWMYIYNVNITDIQSLSISTVVTHNTRLKNILDKHNIKPVLLFENLTNSDTKKIAYRSLKPFSGIYMIVNLVTGKYYVGSAVTGNLYMRFHKHLFYFAGNKRVANAVNKYGLSEFAFLVLEIVPQKDKIDSTLLLNREDHYLETLKPEYNIAPLASNSLGWKHSEESLAKMRENYSEDRRQQVGNINKGKSLSLETRELIRKSALLRESMSIETRMKCAVNVRPVIITNLDGSNAMNFVSMKEASIAISCNEKTIRRALNGDGIVKKNYIVKEMKDIIEE